jgi:transposase
LENEQLLMTQKERDRLVALKKTKKGVITQRQAAEEIGVSERQVRRMLAALKTRRDKAVIHAGRGRSSNRRIADIVRQQAMTILSQPVCHGFGPSFAADHLREEHGISVGRETLRGWMGQAKLWRAKARQVGKVHQWRERRSRRGEMVQWDTSDHDWLEGRGERLYLIGMIDDASSEFTARFARHDSTEENMRLVEVYLKRNGRPVAFYTDKASLFQNTPKVKRDDRELPREERDPLPPTQIGRALNELGIVWIAAHSPQAKGRIERSFQTAQDRLVKGLRVAGATTLKQANAYLEEKFLPWWKRTRVYVPASPDDAHRPLTPADDLASALSHVETRRVASDYTIRFRGKLYQIDRASVRAGLRDGTVRVEERLDGTVAVRFRQYWLQVSLCEPRPKKIAVAAPAASVRRRRKPQVPSEAMRRSMSHFLGGPKKSITKAGRKQPGDLSR